MVKHAIVLADEDWYNAMASNVKMYTTILVSIIAIVKWIAKVMLNKIRKRNDNTYETIW